MPAATVLHLIPLIVAVLAAVPMAQAASAPDATGARQAVDADQDGCRDAAERAALSDRRQLRRERMLTRFDADHDGTLDATERAVAERAWEERLKAERPQRFAAIDANHDGTIDAAERRAARAHRRDRPRRPTTAQ